MVMTGNVTTLMSQVTDFLSTHFKIKDLGDLHYFLGIQIVRNVVGIFLNQSKYATDILKDFESLQDKSAWVPIAQHHDLLHDTDSPLLGDLTSYRRVVGKIIYLTISRPDLSYDVHVLAQYMHAPRSTHWHAVLKLLKYL